ncbi:hypothetical protein ES703_119342 [subsurface metagenome]
MQQLVTSVINLACGIRSEQLVVYAEWILQLHVRPVIKWISQAAGYGLGPLLELLIITRIAGTVLFVDTIGSHCPPFVVVVVKPNLGQILELMVVGDLLSRQVAVIIVDRHLCRVLMVKGSRSLCLEKKIFCHKFSSHR